MCCWLLKKMDYFCWQNSILQKCFFFRGINGYYWLFFLLFDELKLSNTCTFFYLNTLPRNMNFFFINNHNYDGTTLFFCEILCNISLIKLLLGFACFTTLLSRPLDILNSAFLFLLFFWLTLDFCLA